MRRVMHGNRAVENGNLRVSESEPWIQVDGLQVEFLRLVMILSSARRQVEHVSFRVRRGTRIKARPFVRREFCLESVRDSLGDITLDGEDVRQLAVVSLSPQVGIRVRFYQLGRDAHLSVSAPHASLENIAHAQLLPDLAKIPIRAG